MTEKLKSGVMMSITVLVAVLLISGLMAIVVPFHVEHDHGHPGSAQELRHSGSLDVQGCHSGPNGYHCHR